LDCPEIALHRVIASYFATDCFFKVFCSIGVLQRVLRVALSQFSAIVRKPLWNSLA